MYEGGATAYAGGYYQMAGHRRSLRSNSSYIAAFAVAAAAENGMALGNGTKSLHDNQSEADSSVLD